MHVEPFRIDVVPDGSPTEARPRTVTFVWHRDSGLSWAHGPTHLVPDARQGAALSKRADDLAFRITSGWYRLRGKDVTADRGVSYGSLVQQELHRRHFHVIRSILLVRELFDRRPFSRRQTICLRLRVEPEAVALLEGIFSAVGSGEKVRLQLEREGRRTSLLARARDRTLELIREPLTPLTRWAKDRQLDGLIKLAFGLLAGRKRPCTSRASIFLFDVRNRPTVQQLSQVAEGYSARAGVREPVCIATEPRNLPAELRERLPWAYLGGLLRPRDVVDGLRAARHVWECIQKARADLREAFRVEGIDLAPLLSDSFFAALRRRLRVSAIERQVWERVLTRWEPDLLTVGCDAHPTARLAVQVAGQHGVGTVTLQHGATCSPHGYAPVYADRAAVWGPASREWFAAYGVPDEKLVVTGNPRFGGDPPTWMTDGAAQEGPPTPPRDILLATQPVGSLVLRKFLDVAREALTGMGCRVRLRPHPGEAQRSLLHELVGGWPDSLSIEFDRERDVLQSLRRADLVVMMQSTLGLEALLAGRVLVIVDLAEVPECIPYRDYKAGYFVQTAPELRDVLTRADFRQLAGPASRLLRDYLSLDGLDPLGRVVDLLLATRS